MRLDVVGRPQPLHARRRDAGGASHRAATPPPQMRRRRHRLLYHFLHRPRRQPGLAPAARRDRSIRPAGPLAKRPTQRFTVSRDIPSRSAICRCVSPSALSRMISTPDALAHRHRPRAKPAPQFPGLFELQLDPLASHPPPPFFFFFFFELYLSSHRAILAPLSSFLCRPIWLNPHNVYRASRRGPAGDQEADRPTHKELVRLGRFFR